SQQGLELGHEFCMPSQRKLSIHPVLLCDHPELFEAPGFTDRPGLVRHIGEGRAPPAANGFGRQARTLADVTALQSLVCPVNQALEARAINLVGTDLQGISRSFADEQPVRRALRLEDLAERGDVYL